MKGNIKVSSDILERCDFMIQKLFIEPYSKVELETGEIEQTGSLKLGDVYIGYSTIDLNIHNYNRNDPFLTGEFSTCSRKTVLNKLNNDKNPILNKEYIIISGNFNEGYSDWIDRIDFGNSGFDKAECYLYWPTEKDAKYLSNNRLRSRSK